MYSIIKPLHAYFAWIVLALLLFVVIRALFAVISKKNLQASKIEVYAFVSTHIQLLFGLIIYFVSPNGIKNMSSETMKDSFGRMLVVEHPLTNILAIALITIGYLKLKKMGAGGNRARTMLIYYGIGLLLLLSRIPWTQWLNPS
jgi:hypothetical protein